MCYSNYNPGFFTIELSTEYWPIAQDYGFAEAKARAALLHEYTHYLQDTVTRYGIKYREQLYKNSKDEIVAGGGSDSNLCSPCFGGDEIDINADGRPVFCGDLIGATAIKENMARQAEFYVYGNSKIDNCQSVIYTGVTSMVKCISHKLAQTPLALYILDDCCLGTDDPIMSLLTYLRKADIAVVEGQLDNNDALMPHWLYNNIHTVLGEAGIAVDETPDTAELESEDMVRQFFNRVTSRVYSDEDECKHNIDEAIAFAGKIEENVRRNANLRNDNPYLLADAMIKFKADNDFAALFAQFGTPLIKQTGTRSRAMSNIDKI